jgi:hypothetical protein
LLVTTLGDGRRDAAPTQTGADRTAGTALVTRDDTAAVLVALLDVPGTAGKVLELREGGADVREAVAALG